MVYVDKSFDTFFIEKLCVILAQNKSLKNKEVGPLIEAFKRNSALNFEDFLIEEDIVSKEDLLHALSEYYNLPAIDVMGELCDHHLVSMFPKDVMLRNGFIPYERDGDVLIVIAARPNHPQLPEIIGKFVSYDVTFMVGLYRGISDMIQEFFYKSLEEEEIEEFERDTDLEDEAFPLKDVINRDEEE